MAHNVVVRGILRTTVVALAITLASVGPAAAQSTTATTTPVDTTASSTTPAVTTATDATAPTAAQPDVDYRPGKQYSYFAQLIARVGLYPKAGGGKIRGTLAPWISDTGNSLDLLVLDRRVLPTGEAWLEVRLPSRPNDASAWIPESNVILHRNPMRIEISLHRHLLRVFRLGHVVLSVGVALGAPATPTPLGHFAVYQKIREVWWSPLGPWAIHLTAHSNVLFEFAGGPGRVAIHGARGVLWAQAGTNPSHGCIRVPDPGIRRVAPLVTAGTPVDIVR